MPSVIGQREKLHSVSPRARYYTGGVFSNSKGGKPDTLLKTLSSDSEEVDPVFNLPISTRRENLTIDFPNPKIQLFLQQDLGSLEQESEELFPKIITPKELSLPGMTKRFSPKNFETEVSFSIIRNQSRKFSPQKFEIKDVIGFMKKRRQRLKFQTDRKQQFLDYIEGVAVTRNQSSQQSSKAIKQIEYLKRKIKKCQPKTLFKLPRP